MRPGVYHERFTAYVWDTRRGRFLQDDDRVGSLYIRTQEAHGDLVRFLIKVPIIADQDYRLDAVEFEFMSDVIEPLIMLEPAHGTLTQDISFTRVDSMVRLSVPDTPVARGARIRSRGRGG